MKYIRVLTNGDLQNNSSFHFFFSKFEFAFKFILFFTCRVLQLSAYKFVNLRTNYNNLKV